MRQLEKFEGVTEGGTKYYGVTVQMENEPMSANTRQIGGKHYSKEYQHWDWVACIGLDYLGGCATKYLDRWRDKNGLPDLEKADHYLEKLIEVAPILAQQRGLLNLDYVEEETTEFLEGRNIPQREAKLFQLIASWTKRSHLTKARRRLQDLIDEVREEMASRQPAEASERYSPLVTLRREDTDAYVAPRAG